MGFCTVVFLLYFDNQGEKCLTHIENFLHVLLNTQIWLPTDSGNGNVTVIDRFQLVFFNCL